MRQTETIGALVRRSRALLGVLGLSAALLGAGAASAQDRWRMLPPDAEMPTPRAEAATAVLDGRVCVMGGRDGQGEVLAVAECFDPFIEAWTDDLPALGRVRYNAAAVELGGAIYVIGGRGRDEGEVLDAVERFDPGEGRWRDVAPMRQEREGHAAVAFDGRIFVFGGSERGAGLLETIEVYDPGRDAWELLPGWQLDLGRRALSAAAFGDSLYVFGGLSQFGPVARVEVFGRDGGRRSIPTPPGFVARRNFAAVVHEESVFVIGGRGPEGAGQSVLRDAIAFSPLHRGWSPVPSLQTSRESFGAASVGGRLIVLGGRDAFDAVTGSVEVLDTGAAVADEAPVRPAAFTLGAAFPDPFAAGTTIPFDLPGDVPGRAVLDVHDLFGRRVTTLVDAVLAPGRHAVTWDGRAADGRSVASGVYLVRLRHGTRSAVRAVAVVR